MTVESSSQLTKQLDNQKFQEARSLASKMQYTQARLLFQELANNYQDNPQLFYFIGVCLYNEKEYLSAMGNLAKAIELDPDNPEYRSWFGACLESNGQRHMAIKTFERVLELDPDNLNALSWKGYIHSLNLDDMRASECLRHAVSLQPSNDNNLATLALVLGRNGQYDEALKLINKAIRLKPKNASHHTILGDIHRSNGNIDEAVPAYLKALEIDPTRVATYYELVNTKKIKDPNDRLIKRMERALKGGMPSHDRSYLHFALGEAYNSSKQWDKAFAHFDKANMLVHSPYVPKENTKQFSKIKKIFNQQYFQTHKNTTDHDTLTPIFVVGMMRSGTSLIDQILSSHSQIDTVGESMEIANVIIDIGAETPQSPDFPECLSDLSQDQIRQYATQYLEKVRHKAQAENARFIVDKMPSNFTNLGLIAALFPNAKIIHSMRHPMDVCLSCYFTGFTFSEHLWAHNLEYIGRYYRDYLDLMRYWHKVLPLPILDVQYENVVSDLESNARHIIDFCGLEWEPGCLEFYKTKRSVVTASVVQVRQPIYSSSVERWVPYAKHLQPLVTALGDVLKDDAPHLRELGLTVNTRQPLIQRVSSFFHS